MIQVTNKDGRVFNIRLVFEGDSYGLNNCLTLTKKDGYLEDGEFLIEFYDNTYAYKGFDHLGQFVSRYYSSTLLNREDKSSGIALDGGVPEWYLDTKAFNKAMDEVVKLLKVRGLK